MDLIQSDTYSPAETLVMDFGWGPDSHALSYSTADLPYTGLTTAHNTEDESISFAEAISTFTCQEPAVQEHDLAPTMIDPANMWLDLYMTPSTVSEHHGVHTSMPKAMAAENNARGITLDTLQFPIAESEPVLRARYAASQRHRKAQKYRHGSHLHGSTNEPDAEVAEKKQRLREKNKVAAAKCRLRKGKQAETMQANGADLSKTNAQLKSCLQELRRELNGLRASALGHADCDCPVDRYNQNQAKRVIAEFYSSCGGIRGTSMTGDLAGLRS